jgi:hypothetical protein
MNFRKVTSTISALPVRIKALHFVNPPAGFSTVFKIFSTFLPEKIRNRAFVHATFEDLHEKFPKSKLPEEYGGEAGKVDELVGMKVVELNKFIEL